MSYHPLSAYNCHRLSTIIPTSIFRLPTIAGFALTSSQAINPSPSSVLLISEDIEQVEPHPAMQQILSDHQNMHPASYPTAYRDLTSKTEPPSASAMVLPFPAVDYFGMYLLKFRGDFGSHLWFDSLPCMGCDQRKDEFCPSIRSSTHDPSSNATTSSSDPSSRLCLSRIYSTSHYNNSSLAVGGRRRTLLPVQGSSASATAFAHGRYGGPTDGLRDVRSESNVGQQVPGRQHLHEQNLGDLVRLHVMGYQRL